MKLNIALVGTNFISDAFVSAAKELDGVFVYAVYSRGLDTGKAFAAQHNIKKVYTDYEKMLKDDAIAAVYIASPIFCHKEQAILAMRAKKHVLCEKSISVNLTELKEMRSVAKEEGVVLIEAMRPQYDPFISALRSAILSLGGIRSAELEFCQYSRRYDSFKSGVLTNAFDPRIKNSALSDIGIYPLHIALSLFGEPVSVSAKSSFLDNGFEAEGEAVLEYPDFSATLRYSKVRQGENISKIVCDGGSIFFDKPNAPTFISIEDKNGRVQKIDFESRENNMVYEISAFCDMCRGAIDHEPYLAVTESVMRTVDKIYESASIGFER